MATTNEATHTDHMPRPVVYDGFISYSHVADDLLAPRLQAGLQRFAKPWWKRRALRIFRDESSLSANPHLWSSITEALDGSDWFVLLLSEEAAQSEWVNREVEYWVANKDPSRILPVVTDGEFEWADGDISPSSTAAPPALSGVFSDEPRWVDLRWARTDEHLDLNNPRFSDAVADVASAIRGVPKDELESEEVRQHRRTIRTAWAAGVVVLLLGIAAMVGAVVAVGQSNEAQNQRDEAERQAEIADEERRKARDAEADALDARDEAQDARDEAERRRQEAEAAAEREAEQRAEAQRQAEIAEEAAQLARSQELAAASTSALESDPELASLLAVLSIQLAPEDVPPESVRALRKADQANLLRKRIPMEGEGLGSLTPDEESIITFTSVEDMWYVSSYDLATGAVNWRTSVGEYFDEGLSTALSPEGSLAVMTGRLNETNTGVFLVLSLTDGEVLGSFIEECPGIGWQESGSPFTPDGSLLALSTGTADCEKDPEESWVSFRDTTTWQEVDRLEVPGYFEAVQFDESGTRFLLTDAGVPAVDRLELRSYPDMEPIQSFGGYRGQLSSALSPSGDSVAYTSDSGVRLHDAESGEFLGWVEGEGVFLIGAGLVFSPDGSRLLVTTEEGAVLVDSSNGKLITRLGPNRGVLDASFTRDGSSVVTTYLDQIEIWNLTRSSGAVPLSVQDEEAVWVNPNRIFDRPSLGMLVFVGTFPVDLTWWLIVVDDETRTTVGAIQALAADQLPDGRFFVFESSGGPDELMYGGLALWDPRNDSLDRVTECSVLASVADESEDVPVCPDGEPVFGLSNVGVAASPDGSMVAAVSGGSAGRGRGCEGGYRLLRVWGVESKEEIATIEIDGCEDLRLVGDSWVMTTSGVYDLLDGSLLASHEEHDAGSLVYELTPDGKFVLAVAGGPETEVVVIETNAWDIVGEWDAHEARVRGLALSPDSSRLATTGTDGLIRIWDLGAMTSGDSATPRLLDEIPLGIASDAYWISDNSLGVLFRDGTWTEVTLDPFVLAAGVLERLQRSFTVTECDNYRIDQCPTLDEMKSG